uniref:DUF7356 domain-containing protein n=1 Tax=Oryza brachyantha TaxID=4533 RepID=J3MXX9_ORYBR
MAQTLSDQEYYSGISNFNCVPIILLVSVDFRAGKKMQPIITFSLKCVEIWVHNSKLHALLSKSDSLDRSLVMDNKGMNPLDVGIATPDFVTSAEDTIHLNANENNEDSWRSLVLVME